MKPTFPEYRKLMKELNHKRSKSPPGNRGSHEPITLFIKDESEIIEPHSSRKSGSDAIINPEIVEYLESRVNSIPFDKKLTVEIEYGAKMPDDPLLPEKLIKKELKTTITASLHRNRRIMAGSLLLALAGIGILAFINKFPYINDIYAFNELFVVISWVFIWRFVEMFFFERTKLQFRRMKLFQIFFAEYRIKSPS